MADGDASPAHLLRKARGKFQHPEITANGDTRARVKLRQLETLWVNTGTLCNIECAHCYIKSSPTNDRLTYLTLDELAPFLAEAGTMGTREIGFTGGEPFMNPHMTDMLTASLETGFQVLVLTNAMKPMMRPRIQEALQNIHQRFGNHLRIRISLDHHSAALHDEERGPGAFATTLKGLRWLDDEGFALSVAARLRWGDSDQAMRGGFADLFAREEIALDAHSADDLILFPEMDESADVPEITESCWGIVGTTPEAMMCASSRMLVKRKGADKPAVIACTLLPDDPQFELGETLTSARRDVALNHPHCARFCVLGNASCSG